MEYLILLGLLPVGPYECFAQAEEVCVATVSMETVFVNGYSESLCS
jgi:hypothetical protein